MAVDLLLGVSVEGSELVHEVLARLLVIVWRALVVDEAMRRYRARCDLLAEEIHLVEEEDEGGFGEPMRIRDGFPQHQCFVHLILQ